MDRRMDNPPPNIEAKVSRRAQQLNRKMHAKGDSFDGGQMQNVENFSKGGVRGGGAPPRLRGGRLGWVGGRVCCGCWNLEVCEPFCGDFILFRDTFQ